MKRLFSFGMLLAFAFLLLISLMLSALLAAFGDWLSGFAPSGVGKTTLMLITAVINYGIILLIFAMIYRIVPDAVIQWKDVWLGAIVTTLLFLAGKWAIGLYIGSSDPGSAYGAAGSIILILVWVYMSSMLLFLGAEFTQVWARSHGRAILPSDHAVRVYQVIEERKPSDKPGSPIKPRVVDDKKPGPLVDD